MGQLLRLFLVLALSAPALVACGDDDDDDDTVGDGDADSDSDADSDGDGDGDGDADGDGDGDADACVNPDPCDVYEQCGCDAGQNCTYNGNEKICAPAGTGQQDDACGPDALCDVGLACIGNESGGTCAQYCSDRVRCPGGSTCSIGLRAEGAAPDDPPLAMVCATPSNCDAIANTGCGDGEACYVTGPADGTTDCAPICGDGACGDGEGAIGSECASTNGCVAGATCLSLDGENFTCLQHCDATADPSTCPDGTTCQALVNGEPLGLCVPAQ